VVGGSPGQPVRLVPPVGRPDSLITNDAVPVSEYGRQGLPEPKEDEGMKEIPASSVSDGQIVGIRDARLLHSNGGGVDFRTRRRPAIGSSEGPRPLPRPRGSWRRFPSQRPPAFP
jgi:hypothetical protein